jgi:hypothetical protein
MARAKPLTSYLACWGPTVIKSMPTITQRPPTCLHLSKFPSPPNSTKMETKTSTHGPLEDIPGYSIFQNIETFLQAA